VTVHPDSKPIGAASYLSLGCSIGDYGSTPGCIFEYRPMVRKVSRIPPGSLMQESPFNAATDALGLEHCRRSCISGVGCAHLGIEAYKLFEPLRRLISHEEGKDREIEV